MAHLDIKFICFSPFATLGANQVLRALELLRSKNVPTCALLDKLKLQKSKVDIYVIKK